MRRIWLGFGLLGAAVSVGATVQDMEAIAADQCMVSEKPDGSAGPCAVQATLPGPFIVFFSWGSMSIDVDAEKIIDQAAASYADGAGAYLIELEGHSDRSGPARVNERISRQRAHVVRDALIARGVASDDIRVSVAGENALLIGTPDGVREAQNRRVEILFSQSEN